MGIRRAAAPPVRVQSAGKTVPTKDSWELVFKPFSFHSLGVSSFWAVCHLPFPQLPSGINFCQLLWSLPSNTHTSCFPFPPCLPHYLIRVSSTPQINYSHLGPCLRACFWKKPVRTVTFHIHGQLWSSRNPMMLCTSWYLPFRPFWKERKKNKQMKTLTSSADGFCPGGRGLYQVFPVLAGWTRGRL